MPTSTITHVQSKPAKLFWAGMVFVAVGVRVGPSPVGVVGVTVLALNPIIVEVANRFPAVVTVKVVINGVEVTAISIVFVDVGPDVPVSTGTVRVAGGGVNPGGYGVELDCTGVFSPGRKVLAGGTVFVIEGVFV
jgi:hypothetical protein